MAGKRASVFQLARLVLFVTLFTTGCLSIVTSQTIIIFFVRNDELLKQKLLNQTKESFVILLTFITNLCSPTEIVITHDGSIPNGSFNHSVTKTGNKILLSHLDPKAIVISNHQIYADWLFMWWCAYINKTADQFFIIMKNSLRKIPILGYGMANYKFMFLSRKWDDDKEYMNEAFSSMNKNTDENHWLLIFPEGTNMSGNTRERSDKFVAKSNVKPLKHVLLPRVKGLYLAVKNLQESTKVIYDFTFGYSGHTPEEYAQDIYTLGAIYLFGKGPKSVKIHIRSYLIEEIPVFAKGNIPLSQLSAEEEEREIMEFQNWVYDLWYTKDELMDTYYKTGDFPDTKSAATKNEKYVSTLKLTSRLEILQVYYIPFVSALLAYIVYKLVRSFI